LNGLRVTVELGDMLPGYEFDALRVMKELEEEEKSKFPNTNLKNIIAENPDRRPAPRGRNGYFP